MSGKSRIANFDDLMTTTDDSMASLSPEQRIYMERIFTTWRSNIGQSWLEVLKPEFNKPYFIKLLMFVAQEMIEAHVYPPPEDVFSFTQACDITNVKVIIVGQNPYHKPNRAHGVLLLNTMLTVREGVAGSHMNKGWETFTDAIISWFNNNCSGIVFILWGEHAKKKRCHIDEGTHYILEAAHPSPLSAHGGFFGCGHFSKCNQLLASDGKMPINWSYLP
ncbi:hypothetical protein ACJMK2_006308 [Sinanodonta woodiana]|uniref:Uracil-DNA glycosylase-like domain-containing protein n=1 Tax=Sinanodonta woodiana TaxID=1069815 RepID=A0ABD3VVV4_SINWO